MQSVALFAKWIQKLYAYLLKRTFIWDYVHTLCVYSKVEAEIMTTHRRGQIIAFVTVEMAIVHRKLVEMAECVFSHTVRKLRLYFVLTDATSISSTLQAPCPKSLMAFIILPTVIYLVFRRCFNDGYMCCEYGVDMVDGLQVGPCLPKMFKLLPRIAIVHQMQTPSNSSYRMPNENYPVWPYSSEIFFVVIVYTVDAVCT